MLLSAKLWSSTSDTKKKQNHLLIGETVLTLILNPEVHLILYFDSYCTYCICNRIVVFRGRKWGLFLWISNTYVVPTLLLFSEGEDGTVLLWNFLWSPKRDTETSRPDPRLVLQSFLNTVLLMIMKQNWKFESRSNVIISSQPYWNYQGFMSARRT